MKSSFIVAIALLACCCAGSHVLAQPRDSVRSSSQGKDEFITPDSYASWDAGKLRRLLVYPKDAPVDEKKRSTLLRVLVDKEGRAQKCTVDESSGIESLDKAAIDGVRRLMFIPAMYHGAPIATWVQVPVDFMPGPVESELPEPDDFVAVEVEPTWDQAELTRRLVYPELARRKGIEGDVIVRFLIDKNGTVVKYKIDRGSGSDLLDQAAIDAIKATHFTPARQKGKGVAVWVQIPVAFKLNDPPQAEPEPESR